jgi:beta-galactosidase
LKTAGASSRIELLPDVRDLFADGRDICHVEFRVVDAQGTRVPDGGNELTFKLDGPANLLGLENGDLNSPADYTSRMRKAWHGRGLAIVQSTKVAGTTTLRATAPGLEPASITISSGRVGK